jgi:hypothetical protein
MVLWYFSRFGNLYQEESGNPVGRRNFSISKQKFRDSVRKQRQRFQFGFSKASFKLLSNSGLPDGLFLNQKSHNLEGLGIENIGIFYDHLEYFMAIWYNLWLFGIVCGHMVYFFPFWYVWTEKNLATLLYMQKI